ncbi:hypothetical protein DERP_009981 [Dermatophagoides pteronyssinus]|uniref:Uncharacterized protein n=1 Tax=Dermatophagoides pteronyssinus TaxID=6956 RepID=A0ABQ8J231_DERPT|nr:hypothetical protein DERP_009981 [Dermatophagoides pteronyssinus]
MKNDLNKQEQKKILLQCSSFDHWTKRNVSTLDKHERRHASLTPMRIFESIRSNAFNSLNGKRPIDCAKRFNAAIDANNTVSL